MEAVLSLSVMLFDKYVTMKKTYSNLPRSLNDIAQVVRELSAVKVFDTSSSTAKGKRSCPHA